jgi:entericidin B
MWLAGQWDALCCALNYGDTMMKKLSALLLLTWILAGCNTMAGAGKDIERGGEKIQGSAERNK